MPIQSNEAKDEPSFEPYPTYSMAILWNMRALTPEEFEHAAVSPTPLDGDALAHAAGRSKLTDEAWDALRPHALAELRDNHAEINRPNR